MKKRPALLWVILLTIAMMACLTACGGTTDDPNALTKDQQDYEYTHINIMFKHIAEEDKTEIGDWSYGTGNEDASRDRFKTDCPIFTIYINPLADDALIDRYVANAMVMDDHMGKNKQYLKYARKNQPYFITLECLGNVLSKVELTGKADPEQIRKDLKDALPSYREDALKKLADFDCYINTCKNIQKDENGIYYYVIDSHHVSDSLDEIMPVIDEIGKNFPYTEDEMSHWNGSFAILGDMGGDFQVYFDQYGNEPLFAGRDGVNFSYPSRWVYNMTYKYFVPCDTITDGPVEMFYYNMTQNDGNDRCFGGFSGRTLSDDPVPEQEVKDWMYWLYDRIVSEHEEHGIRPLTDTMRLTGDTLLKDSEEPAIEIYADIPMGDRLTKEEFFDYLAAGSNYFDPNDRILGDDCIDIE